MSNNIYTLDDFDFKLPDNLIAQYPIENREDSRLLVLNKKTHQTDHKHFKQIISYFEPGDVLVFNNAKVIKARIYCKRKSGSNIELVLIEKLNQKEWKVLCNRKKRMKVGEIISPVENKSINFLIKEKENDYIIIESNTILSDEILNEIGNVPLPPYIDRESTNFDSIRYQTVYAEESGAVASPTAGLHFTNELLNQLKEKGVNLVFVTLIVSWGTFQPVRSLDIETHKMHQEKYVITENAAEIINNARKEGCNIFSVGTTSLRVLETTYINGYNIPGEGLTDLFIYPPYEIKSIDGLITNFHTPKSTLLMLVSAFGGYDYIFEAYKEAVSKNYRFFSYGDSMIIL